MTPTATIEQAFARFVAEGSEVHLRRVFDEAHPRLFRLARRFGLDAATAEDVVQETFLVVLRQRRSFHGGSSFHAWSSAILTRVARSERRMQQRYAAALGRLASQLEWQARRERHAPSVDEDAILRCIRDLPEGQRGVLEALLLRRESPSEVARRLGVSRSVVATRLSRGLERLRRRLGAGAALALFARASDAPRGVESTWQVVADAARDHAPTTSVTAGAIGVGSVALVGSVLLAGVLVGREDVSAARPGSPDALVAHSESGSGARASNADPSGPSAALSALRVPAVEAASPTTEDATDRSSAPFVVRALDPTGRPAPAGLAAYWLETGPGVTLPTEPLVPVGSTDADGALTIDRDIGLEDDSPLLLVRGHGLVGWVDCASVSGAAGIPDVRLRPDVSIDVTVVDEDGRAIEGAFVAACIEGSRFSLPHDERPTDQGEAAVRAYRHLNGATTDPLGRATLGGLARGDETPSITICSAWKAGHVSDHVVFPLRDGDALRCELVLPSTVDRFLTGVVVDGDGSPVPGVDVHVEDVKTQGTRSAPLVCTDAEGHYSLPFTALEELPRRLDFVHAGHVTRHIELRSRSDLALFPLEVDLAAAAVAGGRVLTAGGAPLVGARVRLRGCATVREAVTDEQGRFGWSGCHAGPAVLTVDWSEERGPRTQHLEQLSSVGPELEIRVHEPVLRARHVDVTFRWPEPVGDAELARAVLVPRDVRGAPTFVPLARHGTSGARATFVPVGHWVLQARDTRGRTCVQAVEVVGGRGPLGVRARFDPTGGLACALDFGAGEPPAIGLATARLATGADVPRWLLDGTYGEPTVLQRELDGDGTLRLGGLVRGRWQVAVFGHDWAVEPTVVDVTSSSVTHVEVDAAPAGFVSFFLPRIGYDAVCFLEVRRPGSAEWHLWCFLDVRSDGIQSNLVRLPPGAWQWRVVHRGYGKAGEPLRVYPRLTSRVDVVAGERCVVDARARADWVE